MNIMHPYVIRGFHKEITVLVTTVSLLVAVQSAQATAINWTGATNGLWDASTTGNWSTAAIPTSADDVTILGPGNVAGALNINVTTGIFANTINFTDTAAVTLTNTTSGADQSLSLTSGLTTGTGGITIGSVTANQGINIALGGSQTWSIGSGGLTFNNSLSNAGAYILTKTGTGTLTLAGSNAGFTGGVVLAQGTLSLNNTNALSGATSLTLNGGTTLTNNTAITLSGNPTQSWNGNITMSSNAMNLGSGAVTLSGSNVSTLFNTTNALTVGGNIGGSSSLTKASNLSAGNFTAGSLILNGAANAYTGGTIIQQGQVQFGSTGSLASYNNGTHGKVLLAALAPKSNGFQSAALVANYALDQNTLNAVSTSSAGVVALGANSGNALDFNSAGLSNVSLGGNGFTYSGALTPFKQTYQLGGSAGTSASFMNVTSALGNVNGTATNLIVNPLVVGNNPGSVTLGGAANTYTGATTVNSGTLKLDFALNGNAVTSNLVGTSSTLALNSGATVNISGSTTAVANSQTFNGTTLLAGSSTITETHATESSLTANLGAITRNNHATLNVSTAPSATLIVNASNGADASGQIVGPWLSVNTGTNTTYAATSGGTLTSLAYAASPTGTQGTLITDVGTNLSSATTNYSLNTVPVTAMTGNSSANTLRYTAGAGTIDIGAVASNTNTLTVNGIMNAGSGTLTINDSGNATATGGLVIGAGNDLVLNRANADIIVNAAVTGTGGVTVNGGGGFVLLNNVNNTYSGGTFLNSSTLQFNSGGSTGAAGAVTAGPLGTGTITLSGGTLQIGTTGATINNAINVVAGTAATVSQNASISSTLGGALTGSGTLTVTHAGNFNTGLTLSGDLSGFTGTLIYNSTASGSNGLNLSIGGTTAGSFDLSQAQFVGFDLNAHRLGGGSSSTVLQLGSLSGTAFWNMGANAKVQVGALNTNTTYGGTDTNTNTGLLTKVGTGTLTLISSTAQSANPTTVNNGTLVFDLTNSSAGSSIWSTSSMTLNGGTLSVVGKATTLQNSSQSFNGTTINAGASTIKVDNGGSANNAVATLAGITRTTTVGTSGGGTVDFILPSGTQSATNGITTTSTGNVLGGIMTQANVNSVAYATVNQTDWAALSTNNIVALSSYTTGSLASNADITTSYTAGVAAAPNSIRFNSDGQTLTLNTGANQVVTGGILVTSSSNSTGSTITGNTLTTGGGREFVFIDYGKLTVASQLVDNAGGSTMLTKSGTGTLTLSNTSNAYSGLNYLNDGIVNIAAAASLGTNATASAISFNGGTLQLASSFNLGSTQGINLGFKGGTFDTNGFASTYAGAIASSGAVQGTTAENTAGQFGFTKAGAGTLTLTGTNTYAGATTITGGTLSVSYLDNATTAGNVTPVSAGGIGKSANYAKNLVLNGGTLQYTGAAASTDRLFTLGDNGGGLDASGSGAVNFTNTGSVGYSITSTGAATNSSPVLTLGGSNTGANTLAAAIGNNGLGTTSLTKSGAGTWVLTGANTYTGGTTVTAGTLNYGNSFTMSGANQITLAATGTAGTNYATVISSAGTLTFGGTLQINITPSLAGGESFSLFQTGGGVLANNFSSVSIAGTYVASLTNSGSDWTGTSGGLNFDFSTATGLLTSSAIPEPATYASIFGVLVLAGAAWKRRRSARG